MRSLSINVGKGMSVQAISTSVARDPVPNPIVDRIVAECSGLVVWRPVGSGPIESRKVPNEAERHQLEARSLTLSQCMQPAKDSDSCRRRIGRAIAALFAGYPSQRNSDCQATVVTYVTQLQDLPAWAVERACSAVGRGKVEGVSLDFAPSVSQLYRLASIEADAVCVAQTQVDAVLRLAPVSDRSPKTLKKREVAAASWLNRTEPAACLMVEAAERQKAEFAKNEPVEVGRLDAFLRECKEAGVDPAGGVSPSLLKSIERMR